MSNENEFASDYDFTKTQRLKIFNKLTENGTKDIEPDDRVVALQVLNDMDRVTLGRQRIKTEDKQAAGNIAAAQALIAALLDQRNLYDIGRVEIVEGSAIKVPEPVLPDYVPKHGEMDVGHPTESYNEFMTRMNNHAT
jgi:hypothetical protein